MRECCPRQRTIAARGASMTGATWATLACFVVLLALLAIVARDSRSVRQQLRNREGEVIGLQLDLDAAVDRIGTWQSSLSDYDSWAADESLVVPPSIADRAVPDRWSAPSGQQRPRK